MSPISVPFQEGAYAYYEGGTIDDNPYEVGTWEWKEWNKGYQEG